MSLIRYHTQLHFQVSNCAIKQQAPFVPGPRLLLHSLSSWYITGVDVAECEVSSETVHKPRFKARAVFSISCQNKTAEVTQGYALIQPQNFKINRLNSDVYKSSVYRNPQKPILDATIPKVEIQED